MAGKPQNENGTVKKVIVALIIIIISGWIAWVCDSIIAGKTDRASATTERAYIKENIRDIKDGIRDLKKFFKVP